MILYIEDLLREINVLNYYRGEAAKRGDLNADVIQSDSNNQDAMSYFIRKAVTDILLLCNNGSVVFTCENKDDQLRFSLTPIREDRPHMITILKEAIRQYIVFEVRRLWMMTVRPEWADKTIREELRDNIKTAFSAVAKGERVRRRATNLAGI